MSPAKRNQIIELWEIEKFGRDSFGDPDAISLYGMRSAEWYSRGVRILARTALEAVRDPLGARIGQDVARIVATAPLGSAFGVVDPFAGSCNALFSILRHLPGTQGLGFEYEQSIFDMTTRNLASLAAPIRLGRLPNAARAAPLCPRPPDRDIPRATVGGRIERRGRSRPRPHEAANR